MRLFLTLLLLPLYYNATAQVGSARIWLSLYFEGGYGIQVTDPNITLDLNSPDDFQYGIKSPLLQGHLQITSRGSYEVWVKSQNPYLSNDGTLTAIPVSTIRIQAGNSVATKSVDLNVTPQLLINNPNKVVSDAVDVTYSIPSNKTNEFLNSKHASYQTVVTYTLILK